MKLQRFQFGDIIENGWAGQKNPWRKSIFIRHKTKTIEVTDGKGRVEEIFHDKDNRNVKVGSIFDYESRDEWLNG